jgi:hypothetical protein
MKYIIFLLYIVCTFSIAFGQISVTQNHLPTVNDTIHYKTGTFINFDPNANGTNYTWDFSQVNVSNVRADTIISVTQTPIVYNIVFNILIANQAYINQTPPSLGVGLTVSEYYDFFKKATNYYRKAGFGATINGVQTPVKYDQPELFFKLPLTYGTSDSSISKYGLPIPGYGYYGQTIVRKHIADGWGTLITPFGTYSAIRVKQTINITDTIFIDSLNFGYNIVRPTSYEYYWLTNSNIRAFAAKVYRNGMFYHADFYFDPLTSISSNYNNIDINVFPNPVSNWLIIENPFNIAEIQLNNLLGQCVLSEYINLGQHNINVENIPEGCYILKLKTNNHSKILKIVIKR